MPADTRRVWLTYASEAIHPMLRARLRHLLWVARDKGGDCRPIDHLRAAVEEYRRAVPLLLAAEGPLATVSRWKAMVALRTAHELAISTRQPTLSDIVTEMVDLAKSALDWPEAAPGVVGAVVDALIGHKEHHDILRPLVEQAASQYEDPHVRISFLTNLRQMEADAEGQRMVDERISDTYATHAERLGGFGKLLCLEEAAAHARGAGLMEKYEPFQRQQQALTAEDLKLSSIRMPMELPPGFLEDAAAVIDAAADVGEALAAIAAVCPDLPPAEGDGGEEAGLERFTERPEGLVELLSHPVATPPTKAQSLARAFRAYWERDDEVGQLSATARERAASAREAIVSTSADVRVRGRRTAGYAVLQARSQVCDVAYVRASSVLLRRAEAGRRPPMRLPRPLPVGAAAPSWWVEAVRRSGAVWRKIPVPGPERQLGLPPDHPDVGAVAHHARLLGASRQARGVRGASALYETYGSSRALKGTWVPAGLRIRPGKEEETSRMHTDRFEVWQRTRAYGDAVQTLLTEWHTDNAR